MLWVLRDVLGMTGTKFGAGWRSVARARNPRPTDPEIDTARWPGTFAAAAPMDGSAAIKQAAERAAMSKGGK
jgi:hypothetical protein